MGVRRFTLEENIALVCPQNHLDLNALSVRFGRPKPSLSRQRSKLLGRKTASSEKHYQRAKQEEYRQQYLKPRAEPKVPIACNPRLARPDWFNEPNLNLLIRSRRG